MEVHREASLRTDRALQGSVAGVLYVRRVLEGTKRCVEGNGVDDVLVKDLGRDFMSNLAHQLHLHRLGDLGRPRGLSEAWGSVVGTSMEPETGVLATVLTPITVDGEIYGTWRGDAETDITSPLFRFPNTTVRLAGLGAPGGTRPFPGARDCVECSIKDPVRGELVRRSCE